MAAPLIEKKTVLTYVGDDGDVALFMAAIDEGDTRPPTRLLTSPQVHEDMGDVVTVTIRPGDGLNDADSEFQAAPGE